MDLNGNFNPAARYVEDENHGSAPIQEPFRAKQYQALSPLHPPVFGTPTKNGKFTEVIVNGETVYTEDHPMRQPQT